MSDKEETRQVIKEGDFAIIITPEKVEGEEFIKSFDINLAGFVSEEETKGDHYYQMMTILSIMVAGYDLSNNNDDVFDTLYEYAMENYSFLSDIEADNAPRKPTISFEDNVIKLNFDTPTGGNA